MNDRRNSTTARSPGLVLGNGIRSGRRKVAAPFAEPLEQRQLPAMLLLPAGVSPASEVEPNDTVDRAQPLGDLSTGRALGATGSIGNGTGSSADVDWYHFTLGAPARVTFTAGSVAGGDAFRAVISLYNEDLYDFGDSQDPTGRRLVAQAQAGLPGDLSRVQETLGAGSYDVAVSGAGNLHFNPLMADSGYAGSTGDYNLLLSAQPLDLAGGSGPVVIASDPASGAAIASSPLAIRLDLSGPVAPSTIAAGTTVRLFHQAAGASGAGGVDEVSLASINFSPAIDELQVFPQAALRPGRYWVVLAGDAAAGSPALAAPDGTPLGSDADHPQGRNLQLSFRVTGIEGGQTAADTLDTAHDLGDVTRSGLVQVAGAIGTDPYYDPSSPDPAFSPGNQVDFYRFQVVGAGNFAFLAEVFAGRIGSPLDPGLALYRVDPSTHRLSFVAGNNNSSNQATATDGSTPLLLDPALYSSLTAGDYVVAVSTGFNTPSPDEGQPLDTPGLYDPNVSHSGQGGFGTGPYVLNFEVHPSPTPPRVLSTSPAEGSVLSDPPTGLKIQFDEPVNLQQSGYVASLLNSKTAIASVYVQGSDGTKYFPRLESFDPATDSASFQMLDALPDGSYTLHLSGPGGLTDLGGNRLEGNDPGGDYVVHFQVKGPARGDGTDPLAWIAREPADGGIQDLGTLFPRELQDGVTVTRSPSAGATPEAGDTGDAFQFRVIQEQTYTFNIQGSDALPADALWLTDLKGRTIDLPEQDGTGSIAGHLAAGTYVLHVGPWSPDQAAALNYQVTIKLIGVADNPIPLVAGPVPALQLRLNALPGPSDAVSPTPTPTSLSPPSLLGELGAPVGSVPTDSPVNPTPAAPTTSAPPPSPAAPTTSAPPPSPAAPGGNSESSGGAGSPTPAAGADPAAFGPQSYSGPADHPASTTGDPRSAGPGGNSTGGPTGGLSSSGVLALSVSPVGSLPGNAEASAAGISSAQVAFSIPSQPSALPSAGQALARLFTSIHFSGVDEAAESPDSPAQLGGGGSSDPSMVFDEALDQLGDRAPIAMAPLQAPPPPLPPTERATAEARGLEATGAVELVEASGIPVSPVEGAEEAEMPGGRLQLANLAWGALIAAVASIPISRIFRRRAARGPAAARDPDRAGPMPEEPPSTRHWTVGEKSARGYRSRGKPSHLEAPKVGTERGLYS